MLVEVMGYVAASLTTIAFAPQAVKTIITKKTRDIALWMYLLYVPGVALWFVYGCFIGSGPLIAANGVATVISGTVLVCKWKYK